MIERWRELFERDAVRAVADLFSGRAALGASMRLDVPEILHYEFPEKPEQQARREALDGALLNWLSDMRSNYQREVRRLDFAVYARRLCDGLQAVHLLDLPRSTFQLRELQDSWLRFLKPLRIAPERDPALELWRVLTRRQSSASNLAIWQMLATDSRPEYLDVALLGLQLLPLQDKADVQRQMLRALMIHYMSLSGSPTNAVARYRQHLAALQVLYPRGSVHWAGLEQQLEEAFDKHSSSTCSVFFSELKQRRKGQKPSVARPLDCPSKLETDRVRNDILESRQTTAGVFAQFRQLIERLQRYADQTGDAYFLVRTLCNHGNLLLKRDDLDDEALDWMGQQIETALHWESSNEFIWTFWSSLLAYRGCFEQQEWVLREAVRLLPGLAACRVELARLLMQRGKAFWPEAKSLLCEAVECNPENEPSRVELARIFCATGCKPEAVEQLQECLSRHPQNEIARNALRTLQQGGRLSMDFAESVYTLAAPAQAAPVSTVLEPLAERASLQRAYWQARAERQGEAVTQLQQQAAAGDSLAGTYLQWLAGLQTEELPVPPHAWSWRAAQAYQTDSSEQDWQALQDEFPERRRETSFLCWLKMGKETPEFERVLDDERYHYLQTLFDQLRDKPTDAPERRKGAESLTLAAG